MGANICEWNRHLSVMTLYILLLHTLIRALLLLPVCIEDDTHYQ